MARRRPGPATQKTTFTALHCLVVLLMLVCLLQGALLWSTHAHGEWQLQPSLRTLFVGQRREPPASMPDGRPTTEVGERVRAATSTREADPPVLGDEPDLARAALPRASTARFSGFAVDALDQAAFARVLPCLAR